MGFAVGVAAVVLGMGFGVAVAGGFFTCKSRTLITASANHSSNIATEYKSTN